MFNNPFEGKSYGMPFNEGDVVGVGYRHRTGTVFFTRNGRKIEDAYSGLRWNLFPTIGANGPCQVHVNLGQRGISFWHLSWLIHRTYDQAKYLTILW
jgi:hypothetical protein